MLQNFHDTLQKARRLLLKNAPKQAAEAGSVHPAAALFGCEAQLIVADPNGQWHFYITPYASCREVAYLNTALQGTLLGQ